MMKQAVVLSLTILLAGPALAGVVFEVETTGHEGPGGDEVQVVRIAAEGGLLKFTVPASDRASEGAAIWRGDRRAMLVVDHDEKSYVVIDEEQLQALTGQMNQAMSQMQEALENVPEENRAMMEKMMKQRMPAQQPKRETSELRKTGERATKSGYPCVKYDVLKGGVKVRELYVTDWSNIEGGKDVLGSFEAMSDFFREMLDSLPNTGGNSEFGDESWEHMKELGGFPVVTREFAADGSLEGEATLRSAKRQTIDPGAFEPPPGYKRRNMLQTE